MPPSIRAMWCGGTCISASLGILILAEFERRIYLPKLNFLFKFPFILVLKLDTSLPSLETKTVFNLLQDYPYSGKNKVWVSEPVQSLLQPPFVYFFKFFFQRYFRSTNLVFVVKIESNKCFLCGVVNKKLSWCYLCNVVARLSCYFAGGNFY